MDYLNFLVKLKLGTRARRTFDRALQALPITQHDKVIGLCLWAGGREGHESPRGIRQACGGLIAGELGLCAVAGT